MMSIESSDTLILRWVCAHMNMCANLKSAHVRALMLVVRKDARMRAARGCNCCCAPKAIWARTCTQYITNSAGNGNMLLHLK